MSTVYFSSPWLTCRHLGKKVLRVHPLSPYLLSKNLFRTSYGLSHRLYTYRPLTWIHSGPSSLLHDPDRTNSPTLPPVWSVLNLPTATFAWPQIKPASKMYLEPRLYMDLSVRRSTSEYSSNHAEVFNNRPSSSSSWTSCTNSLE